ncbi:MAG: hypothetical protein QM762_12600 [Chryseolinea sp.]
MNNLYIKCYNEEGFRDLVSGDQHDQFLRKLLVQQKYDIDPDLAIGDRLEFSHFVVLTSQCQRSCDVYAEAQAEYIHTKDGIERVINKIRVFRTKVDFDFHQALIEYQFPTTDSKVIFH